MDVVEDPETSGVAEAENEEAQGEQTELGLESPEVGESQESDDVLIAEAVSEPPPDSSESLSLKAIIEAAIYVTDEPLTPEQIATAVEQPLQVVNEILQQLVADYAGPGRGLAVRELAGGYKMSTKPEYHESIRRFVKRLQPPLKLSLAALETLAVIAYKQPITGPEILDIRGVQGAGVLKTLLDRKLIGTAGRKNVLGKPMMYKTTREFLIQFGLDSLAELPTLKEFEELGRLALTDEDVSPEPETTPAAEAKADAELNTGAPEDPGGPDVADAVTDSEPKPLENSSDEVSADVSATDESAVLPETQDTNHHA
jgi:segregation and condensation protein B